MLDRRAQTAAGRRGARRAARCHLEGPVDDEGHAIEFGPWMAPRGSRLRKRLAFDIALPGAQRVFAAARRLGQIGFGALQGFRRPISGARRPRRLKFGPFRNRIRAISP